MNRRGFLKFLPAAVIGGKQAAAEAAEKLALPDQLASFGIESQAMAPSGTWAGETYGSVPWAKKGLLKLFNPLWLEQKRNDISVRALDPDLAVMKSMSLSVRIDMQRERNFKREIERERSYYEKVIAGVFD